MFKTSLLIVGNENHFRAVFSFILSVFDCFDQLSVFVLFGGFVISKEVFNDFKRFGTVLVKKKFFLSKNFDPFSVFVLFGRFGRFVASFGQV